MPESGAHALPPILTDKLTQYQPRGKICHPPHSYLPLPDFQSFRQPCIGLILLFLSLLLCRPSSSRIIYRGLPLASALGKRGRGHQLYIWSCWKRCRRCSPPSMYVLKFIYSEKAKNFYEIFPLLLTVCTIVKSKGKISQKFWGLLRIY